MTPEQAERRVTQLNPQVWTVQGECAPCMEMTSQGNRVLPALTVPRASLSVPLLSGMYGVEPKWAYTFSTTPC